MSKVDIFSGVGFLTLAVMRETALGSGRVLGMLLQSCHIKLNRKDKTRLRLVQSYI